MRGFATRPGFVAVGPRPWGPRLGQGGPRGSGPRPSGPRPRLRPRPGWAQGLKALGPLALCPLGPGPWTLDVNLIDRWLLVFYNIKLGASGASKRRVRLAMIANDEGAAIVL